MFDTLGLQFQLQLLHRVVVREATHTHQPVLLLYNGKDKNMIQMLGTLQPIDFNKLKLD